MTALLATLLVAQLAPIGNGNALTLPAARHVVRIDPQNGRAATWLLAVQQDGAAGHNLWFIRSDDEARSWSSYAPIQDDPATRSTVDLLQVGMDVALVYSYEGPTVSGSTAHDVYFQWWRWNGASDWFPDPAVRVFDSTSNSTAYLRAELARDSQGRFWVWAQRYNSDGTFTMVMSVSTNGGSSFSQQPSLDSFADRPGGRIMPVGGNRMILLYGTHGLDPGYMRLRSDSDALSSWGSRQAVFGEGLYHGAALSALGDGSGGVHLFYKDVTERLFYRHWDGTSWSGRQTVEDVADWALQPATTRVGSDVVIFWNHPITTGYDYRFRYRILSGGSLGSVQTLDDSSGFKGYPNAVETFPGGLSIPGFYGKTPDANSGGQLDVRFAPPLSSPNPPPPPPPPPPPSGGTLFSDDFNRNASTLGASWNVVRGAFIDDGRANADLDTADEAVAVGLSCADCSVQGKMINFGVGTIAMGLRVQSSRAHYEVALLPDGRVQIGRGNGTSVAALGTVASGLADLGAWNTFGLSVSGANPVTLVASVNARSVLTITDSSASAITTAGSAEIYADHAGTAVDDFVVTGKAPPATDGGTPDAGTDAGTPDSGTPDAGAPDSGTPDSGTPDSGTPDAGTPDSGTPDAGTPDSGTPDSGTPDSGTPDSGTPDSGTPDAGSGGPPPTGKLFSDDFNRNAATLGTNWTVLSGAFIADGRANSDLDALDRAMVTGITCADCGADSSLVAFGAAEAMLELRVNGNDRYALVLRPDGNLEIRRYRGGTTTALATGPSQIANLSEYARLAFGVSGTAPVTLTASVNGVPRLTVTDATASALTAAGGAGIAAGISGIGFDDFTLNGTGAPGGGGAPDGGPPPDAGTDAGTPDAGPPPDAGTDAGTPDAGPPPDAGTDAGTPDAGSFTQLSVTTTYTGTDFDVLAVDPAGTAYAVPLTTGWDGDLYASTDGRSWTYRGTHGAGGFFTLTSLSDGTLLSGAFGGSGNSVLARSTDHGKTWTDVLNTSDYRTLTSHSFAELDGAVYYLEYQVFTQASTPIRLWRSTDKGATWSVRFTFSGHRHGHGLGVDPARHALWAWFGDTDPQSGVYRSTDEGATWQTVLAGGQDGDVVDGTILSDGSLLCGQDISYLPPLPRIVNIGIGGKLTSYVTLPSPSYSTHAIRGGGYVVGVTRESGETDVPPAGYDSGALWGSADGVSWKELLRVDRLDPTDDARVDVYWELPSGELIVNVKDAVGFAPTGKGYLLLRVDRK